MRKYAYSLLLVFALALNNMAFPTLAYVETTPWVYVDAVYDFEDKGDYNGSVPSLEKVMENASYFTDPNVTEAAFAKLKHYKNEITLYTETSETQSYTGALYEPRTGLLHATCNAQYDFDSVMLTYAIDESLFVAARENGRALLYAFNVNEGTGIRNGNFTSEALSLSKMANRYPDVPLFVRFGAEMNNWVDRCEPADFIKAFRSVSDTVKSNCKSAAMVWGLNYVSHKDIDYMDYYPGDEYVDWVGMCFYADMYQEGTRYYGDSAFLNRICDTMYYKGAAADPVIPLRELCDIFKYRKPVMITECGASYSVNTGNMAGEDTTDFALSALRKIYEYLPMCCPEVKLIAAFNHNMPGEVGSYSLTVRSQIKELYEELAKKPHFISDIGKADNAVAYKSISDGFSVTTPHFPVSCYVKNFGVYEPQIEYYLDGKLVSFTDKIPYREVLDFTNVENGAHTLRIVSAKDGKHIQEKTYNLTLAIPHVGDKVNDVLSTDIVALIDGVPIKSFNIDGNTAVMAEELADYGFNVVWNAESRSLSIFKGSGNVTASFVPTQELSGKIGTPVMDVLFTDIKTYIDSNEKSGFNVGGSTIIYLDDLSAFGNLLWNPSERTISFAFFK